MKMVAMPCTIRDVARAVGLSPATVSMALTGKGRISPETRQKVRAAAQSLGYHAHPLLSKALSLARQPDASRYRETIAFLLEFETETGPDYQKTMFAAARNRARDLGYKLESFVISGKPSEQRRLSRVLQARGIRGLIVIPRLLFRQPRLHIDWEHFAAVEIGRSLWVPRNLHHVETADYQKIIEAIHVLKKAGYKRIGMAVEPDQVKQQRGSYSAAYVATQLRLPPRQQIPPLSSYGPWTETVFRRWMDQYRPDVLFIHDAETIYDWLNRLGLKVPQDISLFACDIAGTELTGLRRDYAGLGKSAVEMVALLLGSGELGLAGNPRCWQVDEFWQVGKTLSRDIAGYLSPEGFLRSGVSTFCFPAQRV